MLQQTYERKRVLLSTTQPHPTPKFTSLEHEVYLGLQRLALTLSYDVAELFRAHGLSAPQFNILRILRGAEADGDRSGLACSEIGDRLLAHAPDLTRLLDRMAVQGLIVRERGSGDRRVVKTRITDKGLSLLADLDAPLANLHLRQLGHLGSERLEALKALLGAAQP
ncbi:MAG: hypothetical protein AVDCRST_MAG86-1054 [uncultured Truepera sp.]|uniref:HTH marR-type domain-containing protein n=1 Tax=uncultured Truepera sp. TaxID=543023 RepID=A0A6J4V269_9DEIN|nr:MAG: hypothetical protein AVDCRST_MAG86-1054 [uncultured Truepera sp.]